MRSQPAVPAGDSPRGTFDAASQGQEMRFKRSYGAASKYAEKSLGTVPVLAMDGPWPCHHGVESAPPTLSKAQGKVPEGLCENDER